MVKPVMTMVRVRRLHRWRAGRGRRLRMLAAAALAVSFAAAVPGTAQAAAACGTAEGFTRVQGGALYRLSDTQLLTTADSLGVTGVVGTGWGSFAWTGAGGDGVLYALTTAGVLRWYRYDTATATWMPGSGKAIAPASCKVVG